MNTKPTTANLIAIVLPALLVIFVIFILVMPKVKEGREADQPSDARPGVEIIGEIDSFEECEAAGFPVMESYPRQCATDEGLNFKEDVGPIVGGDKDVHGCIGSAGYSWCGPKSKCLRIWEEECYESVEQELRYRLAEKYDRSADSVQVSIKQQTSQHLAGEVTIGTGGTGDTGYFLAYQGDDMVELVFDGNGSPDCELLRRQYNFPETILQPNYCD